MKPTEYEAFRALISDVYAFYRHDVSDFALSVWWSAMRQYDLRAVNEAVGRHAVNPDSGQFMPKPADIVKMLGGTTKDSALVAWSKVDKAIRNVGPWEDVAFDDPLIHRVLYDMGGWMMLGQNTSDEIKFIAKEFEARYRGFKMRSENPEYPPVLIGTSGALSLQCYAKNVDVTLSGVFVFFEAGGVL